MNIRTQASPERIEYIDLAKGIAIILVIIGHTIGDPLRRMIYSFHMPLFFILSGTTFKNSNNIEQFVEKSKKGFKHLIIPTVIVFYTYKVLNIIKNLSLVTDTDFLNAIKKDVLSLVFASGASVNVHNTRIPSVGYLWFMFVLYCGRTLFDYLNLKLDEKKLIIYSWGLSIIGVVLGLNNCWLPFSFDIALAILPLFLIGKNYKVLDVDKNVMLKLALSTFLWMICNFTTVIVSQSYMELAYRRYTLYPFCYVVALLGTFMILELCVISCRMYYITKPIIYIGRNSLLILYVHALDDLLWPWVYNWSERGLLNAITRVFVDLIAFVVVIAIKEIYKRSLHMR